MLTKTKAIVLRCLKYSDQKVIVDFYTEVYGRITSMVKLSAKPSGKMKKQLFQPLTSLLIEIDYRQNQQMQRLNDVQLATPWTKLSLDPVRMTVGMFLAEALYYVTRQEQQDVSLFSFIETSLQWFDCTEGNIANFHIAFLVRLTRFLGFMPDLADYEPGQLFDLRNGEFTHVAPVHRDFLTAPDAQRMHQLLRISYPTMHLYKMSRQERRHCLDTIITYYRLHVASFPELKSLAVLQQVFE